MANLVECFSKLRGDALKLERFNEGKLISMAELENQWLFYLNLDTFGGEKNARSDKISFFYTQKVTMM